MINSISIARSGLRGFETGLRAIANDTSNLNTPGFKGSSTVFSDMFYGDRTLAANGNAEYGQFGYGLNTLGTKFHFKQGQLQSTENTLDMAVDGLGFFTLMDDKGNIRYTRDGQFKFDTDNNLVSVTNGDKVMALSNGRLVPISVSAAQAHAAHATRNVTFQGNLSSTSTTHTISNVSVIDTTGTSHTLTLNFAAVSGSSGSWTVTVMDGTTTVGSGTLAFTSGQPDPANDQVSVTYTPSGGNAQTLVLDFSANVTSYDSGSSSSLAYSTQDGFGAGTLTQKTFDSTGLLTLTYSNGQKVTGAQLALAQFRSEDDVEAMGDNTYAAKGGRAWQVGTPGTELFGSLKTSQLELSNVDMSQEFSNLVIMQRGYQACSQVISTASEMLTTLYGMWGK